MLIIFVHTYIYRTDTMTFQAPSEQDRKLWMDVMDGREPVSTENLTLLF